MGNKQHRHSHYLYRFFQLYELFFDEKAVYNRIQLLEELRHTYEKIINNKRRVVGSHTIVVLDAAIKTAKLNLQGVENEKTDYTYNDC